MRGMDRAGWPRALRPCALALALALPLGGCGGGQGLQLLQWGELSPWINAAVFAAAAALVWLAGTRLARYVDEIAERTGVGRAFLGALLLGGITSLPEVATTVTAAATGSPEIAVNNIFGSVAMNVLLLAVVADMVDGGRALTSLVDQPTLILQAALSIVVIAVGAAAVMIPTTAVFGVGAGTLVLALVAVVAFFLVQRFQDVRRWAPVGPDGRSPAGEPGDGGRGTGLRDSRDRLEERLEDARGTADRHGAHRLRAHRQRALQHREMALAYQELARAQELRAETVSAGGAEQGAEAAGEQEEKSGAARKREQVARLSTTKLVAYTVLAALAILGAGYLLEQTGSALAQQTGVGTSMVGFVLLSFATSLPEISAMTSAVQLRQFSLVFSNVFGTNIFNATILLAADAAYRGGPLLEEVGVFAQTAALLGIVLTSVYIAGLITRSDDTAVLRLGKDSLTVIVLYLLGVVMLYFVR